ncbi:FAD-binding protein [Kocuria sp. HSID16901]|nr:FAD-binding protein [Kocuria sp. HSID16901]
MGLLMTTLSNWSGIEHATPRHLWKPETFSQAQGLVQRAAEQGERIRVIGAGHSFTPVALGSDHVVSLDRLSGVIDVDPVHYRARFLAGTRLRDIPDLLQPYGLALPNQGDVNPQSLAGALSTGTHGTGLGFTGLGGVVTGLTILTATGEILRLSETEHPELFDHARVSVGVLGMILEVEIQCVPSFDLIAEETGESLEEVLDGFEHRVREHDHVEFFWFPHTDFAMVKTNTRVALGEAGPEHLASVREQPAWMHLINDELVQNVGLRALCEVGSRFPRTVAPMAKTAVKAMSDRAYRAVAHEVFVTSRRVRFNEMEYALPFEAGPEALREIRSFLDAHDIPVTFPVEARVAAADDVPLSTASGRETMYVAIHRFVKDDPFELFHGIEPILRAHEGRPHWGKRHTLGQEELSAVYPRFEEFREVRRRIDPDAVFGNQHTDHLFGVHRQSP